MLAGHALFGGGACQAAYHCTDHGSDACALACADRTAGDAADGRASQGADGRVGSFELHRADAFYDAHAHTHHAACFGAFIVTAAKAGGAAGDGYGGKEGEA